LRSILITVDAEMLKQAGSSMVN